MNKRNDEYLTKTFPLLYRDRHASMSKSATHWGFCCGDGWFKIVRDLSKKLETMIVNGKMKKTKAAQVKEKFGILRFYMDGASIEMEEEIGRAESLSSITCEDCGKPGKMTKIGGWMQTLCSRCRTREKKDE